MTPEMDAAQLAATRWYGLHAGEHLARDCDRMVDRCTAHLLELLPIARSAAQSVATTALAEIESTKVAGFIDIDRSNGQMVVLRNTEAGTWHLITLPELFGLVDQRQQSSAAG
ncbi:hypothetical protein [Thermomonas fusca]